MYGNTYNSKGELITKNIGSIITGSGNVANIESSGNRSLYISHDNTHPSPDGHVYLGHRLAEEIYKVF